MHVWISYPKDGSSPFVKFPLGWKTWQKSFNRPCPPEAIYTTTKLIHMGESLKQQVSYVKQNLHTLLKKCYNFHHHIWNWQRIHRRCTIILRFSSLILASSFQKKKNTPQPWRIWHWTIGTYFRLGLWLELATAYNAFCRQTTLRSYVTTRINQ